MCKLISLILDRKTEITNLSYLFEKFDFEANIIENKNLKPQFDSDCYFIKLTKGCCDCESGLGNLANNTEPIFDDDYFLKLGVSQEYLDDLKKETQADENNKRKDINRWQNFLKELSIGEKVEKIGILFHDYTTKMESEIFTIKGKTETKISDLSPEFLSNMQFDTLYYILS